jgi:glycosyltransferase involved in cell wall biosynthesis
MKILMLLISHDFPPDIRVEKEARTLLAAGHQVTLVCENRKNRPSHERWNGIDIVRLHPQPLLWRQLNTATLLITLHNPIWERAIKRIIAEEKPDVLHVHDLPFVGPALRLARVFDLPMVADLHENFPAWLEFRRQTTKSFLERLAFSPRRFARYEERVLQQCDWVIVVVEEAAERIEQLGVSPEQTVIVGNTEDTEAVNIDRQDIELPPSAMKLLYVGGIGPDRGLDVAIKAMPKIRRRIPSAVLVLVGDGISRSLLEQLALELGVASSVHFEGQQPFSKVHAYIEAGDVCLVPHIASPEINSTMPHKLFQYMFMKKPVIVSSAKPLARAVVETQAGLVFESGDPDSFAEAVFALQDPEVRQKLGQNGQQAVIERYNWQRDGQRLVKLYEVLAEKTHG